MKRSKQNVVIILTILFIMLTIFVQANMLHNFETFFYNETIEHSSPLLTILIKEITLLGNPTFIIVFCMILLINNKTRLKYGFITSIGVIVSSISNTALKLIFTRERPNVLKLINETNYSFPSGHAMINTTLYSLLGIFIYKNVKNKKLRNVLISICIIMPIIIGISRVYLGVHYITDVIAGWILGLIIGILVYQISKKN